MKIVDFNENIQGLDQSNLKETIDTNYYKDQGVAIGKYNENSDKYLDYQLYLPQDYYNSLIDKEKENRDWYIRPHHIETLTGNLYLNVYLIWTLKNTLSLIRTIF